MTDKHVRILPWLFTAVLVLDQITKYIALKTLVIGLPVPVLGEYLRWTLTFNPGGAFSIRLGGPTYYLISSMIIFLVLMAYVYYNRRTAHIAVPLSIVAGVAA